MTNLPPSSRPWTSLGAWFALALGLALFQAFGNSTFGYIHTQSLFYWWVFQWTNPDSETQHAWFVLAVAVAVLVWNLRRFPDPTGTPSVAGSSFVAAVSALILHALAYRAEQPRVSVLALLLFLWGASGLIWGGRARRAALFPIAFMLFAVPISALDTVGFWLRLAVVHAGSGMAHALGIAVVQSGTQLFAPDGRYQYDVAAACSGIRSLEAFFAITVVVGYLQLRAFGARALLVLACVPLILVGNVARILAIIIAASMGGQRVGETVHDIMGYGVFIIVIIGVLLVAGVLERTSLNRARGARSAVPAVPPARRSGSWRGWTVAALAAVEITLLSRFVIQPGNAGIALNAEKTAPAELPAFVGSSWIGKIIPTSQAELTILPKDTGFAKRLYFDVSSSDQRRRVLMSVVLSGADRSSIHRPELCLIGQGWTIDGRASGSLAGKDGEIPLPCTVLEVHRDLRTPQGLMRDQELVVYSFVGNSRTEGSYLALVIADAWNRLVYGKADRWAYILLQTGAADGRETALSRMRVILDGVSGNLFGKAGRPDPRKA